MKELVRRVSASCKKVSFTPERLFAAAAIAVLAATPFLARRPDPAGNLGVGQPELIAMLDTGAGELPESSAAEEPFRNVLTFYPYVVKRGDTISGIAHHFGLNQDSVISCNAVEKARTLQIGSVLQIPNMNGIMHSVKAKDTLEKLAETYAVPPEQILEANNIAALSDAADGKVFIPEAKLPAIELRRVWGELFRYPSRGWISSPYGYRTDPISGKRRFHNGIDIAGPHGSPVLAAMEGRVVETGYNESAGNYVVLGHVGGYTTFYAHLDTIRVQRGQRVQERQRIGDIGNTGYSTGSHLHFTVFRWGKPVNPALLLH
jgi:murein DD-endopeptidase MepM/ murein hydrolase activator NlpD